MAPQILETTGSQMALKEGMAWEKTASGSDFATHVDILRRKNHKTRTMILCLGLGLNMEPVALSRARAIALIEKTYPLSKSRLNK